MKKSLATLRTGLMPTRLSKRLKFFLMNSVQTSVVAFSPLSVNRLLLMESMKSINTLRTTGLQRKFVLNSVFAMLAL